MKGIFLSLGSNLGDRQKYLEDGLQFLEKNGVRILKRSSVRETDPVGVTNQPKFLNMAVRVETVMSPEELLQCCLNIEHQLGRTRTIRWGPRTIDIDLLLYNDEKIDTDFLQIPHPRMYEREFVLEPLRELGVEFFE